MKGLPQNIILSPCKYFIPQILDSRYETEKVVTSQIKNLLTPSSIHNYSILFFIIMKDKGSKVFKLVKTNYRLAGASKGIVFDEIHGSVLTTAETTSTYLSIPGNCNYGYDVANNGDKSLYTPQGSIDVYKCFVTVRCQWCFVSLCNRYYWFTEFYFFDYSGCCCYIHCLC